MSIDLEYLEKLALEATPGPWQTDGPAYHFYGDDDGDYVNATVVTAGPRRASVAGMFEPMDMSATHFAEAARRFNEQDAPFIAAVSPSTVLALVGRVRASEIERAALKDTADYAYKRGYIAGMSDGSREAEARIEKVVRLRDRMERQRDDIDESVRLSTILADLNAALAEGDEQ